MKPHWLKLQEPIEADFWRELAEVEAEAELHAESLGWLSLEPGVYLHVIDPNTTEVLVVGQPEAGAAVLVVG